MRRIAVVGTSGTGKTTLAKRLARRRGVDPIELDALHHGPNWTPAEPKAFRAAVDAATAGDAWVSDGNYSAVRDLIWSRADTVVWLDYSIGTVLSRLIPRTFRRGLLGEELWNGNRERLWWHFVTRESLFVWVFQTHWKRRAAYAAAIGDPAWAHLRFVRLRSPREAERWLASIDAGVPMESPRPEAAGARTEDPGRPHRPEGRRNA